MSPVDDQAETTKDRRVTERAHGGVRGSLGRWTVVVCLSHDNAAESDSIDFRAARSLGRERPSAEYKHG
jgi:hypothetical protein